MGRSLSAPWITLATTSPTPCGPSNRSKSPTPAMLLLMGAGPPIGSFPRASNSVSSPAARTPSPSAANVTVKVKAELPDASIGPIGVPMLILVVSTT